MCCSAECNELSEMIADLSESFPTLYRGWLPRSQVRAALEKVGFTLSSGDFRCLVEEEFMRPGCDHICVDTLIEIIKVLKASQDKHQLVEKKKELRDRADLRVYETEMQENSTTTAKHSVSPAEERAFIDWINRLLGRDQDLKHHLPIDYNVDGQLYERCRDGLLLCKLINAAVPDTIDERCINKTPTKPNIFKINENLTLAVNSAESIGCCVVNVGPEDIEQCARHLVLGLIWQIIRIGLLGMISIQHHSELIDLLEPGETVDNLRLLSPEDLLLRWVNFHLEMAGNTHRMTNFTYDVIDSEIYATLLQQIAPEDKQSFLIPVTGIMAESNMYCRAEMVLENAEFLNAAAFISPEDIVNAAERGMARDKLHLAFVANLFNLYPGLKSKPPVDVPETLEEKTYRNWMNSMGVAPFVRDLSSDLRSGLIFLQLLDVLEPGTVAWKKIVRVFDPKRQIFQMQDNCAYVVEYANLLNVNVVNLSGEDLRNAERKLTLGLTFQLMRAYTMKMLSGLHQCFGHLCEKDILEWANEKLISVGAPMLASFRDSTISNGVPVMNLINAIKPHSIDKSMVLKDKLANCRIAISTARKIGARVYALPEHLRDVNPKMVMTVFACLMALDIQLNGAP
ncbi:unnamed protein product [Hydatigera taeniaeformis]|uniref:Plastin-3 n=1 Tax=Hydatigena taeniaeformis TaxID=6205 RepID=A0A0R3WQZ8_HYDTA|nr:unnamed protein product [Hydatigera taeniaeformis]